MPKQSKIKSTRVKTPRRIEEPKREYYCCACGREFAKQKYNFPMSQSPIYKGNNSYMPICRNCVNDMYDQYTEYLGDPEKAMRRMCMKFDIYWNPDIYNILRSNGRPASPVLMYISKSNIIRYQGKTYDDTLDEEHQAELVAKANDVYSDNAGCSGDADIISSEIKEFWGPGFTDDMYIELEQRYKFWLSKYPTGAVLDPGEEALLRQICNLEVDINRCRSEGKTADKLIGTLNTLLGSANLKPSQKKESESYIPFGVEIFNWEKEEPVIDPDPEFSDVDGIYKKITIWFLGHLCKMAGIKNSYVPEYDDAMKRLTIERPSFTDDETEVVSDEIFQSGA